jgi:signal transduction histidine kinase
MLSKQRYISIPFDASDLRERNRPLSLLRDLSDLLASTMDLEKLLKEALDMVLVFFSMDAGRIYLLAPDGQRLDLRVHYGMEPRGLEQVHLDEGFTGKAARTKSFLAQRVSDLEDRNRAALLQEKGLEVIICVPMITMGEVEGVMNLAARHIMKLDPSDVDLLNTIGNQIAVAIRKIHYYEELERRYRTLEEKNEVIEFFARSVSHDMKSPAIGIYGLAKRLRDQCVERLDEKGSEYCDHMLKAADHMVELANKINAYVVAKDAPFHLESVPLAEVTASVKNSFQEALESRSIAWVEPEAPPVIVADRLALISVFQNFVENALKHGGEKLGSVRIGYREDGDFHVLTCTNDGANISVKDKEKLFDLFVGDRSAQGTAGSGLGLAIVKEIAKRHGGRAWVTTEPEAETTFYISISKKLVSTQDAET